MPNCQLIKSICLLLFALPIAAQTDFAHPLDPLSKDEIAIAVVTRKAAPTPGRLTGHAGTQSGFKLIPNGFFARNPAMDVPKQ